MLRLMPAPKGLAIVTTTGRRSGKPRVRAMRAVREGSRVYASAILGPRADWLRNVRKDPNVRIKLGRETYRATARELVEPQERAHGQEIYRPIAGWYDYFDYVSYLWGVPTNSKLLRTHDEWFTTGVPVVFELELAN